MAKLYFYYASMNAGKSATLLQANFNYNERGMRTMLWTAALDDRASASGHAGAHEERAIESRIGLHAGAHRFDVDTDLLGAVRAAHATEPLACVLIDEAQFLGSEQVWQCADIADKLGIPVLCFGLRTDFKGALFPGSAVLLGIADSLVELKSVCHCGRKASMNLRVDNKGAAVSEGAQTEIGGNERYVALCRRHFSEALGR
ncbi:thymidine kinase [Novosphingobium sp. YJ-S2-02]|uniref:Thymidine kinase n=1 Tax=Novosphingobium aureum TaxID=2792964 RepID=A0A931MKG9_9SPHN|nr:thymidine kinase [Novosphingobium aureum]MBH0111986.1 thymidine kinase [Novosphingobium aureum]